MGIDVKDKIVVVTGAASGIGFEITDQFLSKDSKFAIILDINETLGAQAVQTLRAKYGDRACFIKCDVTTNLEEVSKEIFDKYGKVDVLINNAGIANEVSAKKLIAIDTTAVIEWSMKFLEHMNKENGGNGGTIINIASVFGLRITPYVPFYHAAKFAVVAFSKSLGHEKGFERSGVRVIALCPGVTLTNLGKDMPKWKWYDELLEYTKAMPVQDAVAVGKAAVEVFEQAESGTTWVIEGEQLIQHV